VPLDPVQKVAQNVRTLREEAGLSQVELSRRSGVDLRSVARLERGERDPGVRTLARLAAGLGLQPAALLEGVPALPP
jgi:transcriptional regulator with XRE-family HTH domain